MGIHDTTHKIAELKEGEVDMSLLAHVCLLEVLVGGPLGSDHRLDLFNYSSHGYNTFDTTQCINS